MCNWKSKTYGGYSDAGAGGGAIRGHAICRSLQIACLHHTANLLSAKFWWVCRYFLCDSWSPNIAPICPLSLRKRTMWSNCHNVCLWYQTIQGSKQWKWLWLQNLHFLLCLVLCWEIVHCCCRYVLSLSFFIRCCRHRRDKRAVFFLLNYFLFLICCCRQQRTILFFFSYIVFLYSLFVVARIGMTRERWWKPEALPLYRCTRQDAPQRG